MPKVILFNGPPKCGKDYATSIVMKALEDDDAVHLKLSQPLKELASDYFGIPQPILEANKDAILPTKDLSYRSAQIGLFEAISQVLGKAWLGEILKNKVVASSNPTIIVSDLGREADVTTLVRAVGANNILIIQIFRKGCTFKGDIRGYVQVPNVHHEMIGNDGDHTFDTEITDLVLAFIAGTLS